MSLYTVLFDNISRFYVTLRILDPAPTGAVTENLRIIRAGAANFYIYAKDGAYAAFDTGFGKPVIRRELVKLGINPDSISAVFLRYGKPQQAKLAQL